MNQLENDMKKRMSRDIEIDTIIAPEIAACIREMLIEGNTPDLSKIPSELLFRVAGSL